MWNSEHAWPLEQNISRDEVRCTTSPPGYDRNVDPDNTKWAGGSYTTINTIVGQEPGSPKEATAVSHKSG